MTIHFLTLALDAMPFITHHLPQFSRLKPSWDWSVIEGVAEPVADTSWVRRIEPRLSRDGTHEYLSEIAKYHPRVRHYHQFSWPGKTAMLNHAVKQLQGDGIVMQVDADELWQTHQLENIVRMFEQNPTVTHAFFRCHYLVGHNIEITGPWGCYGNKHGEWLRAWRYSAGQSFQSHESPKFGYNFGKAFTREETEKMGLVFWHPAYATRAQLRFKSEYYGYKNCVEEWERLQANTVWPCRARDFLSWIKDDAICDLICK